MCIQQQLAHNRYLIKAVLSSSVYAANIGPKQWTERLNVTISPLLCSRLRQSKLGGVRFVWRSWNRTEKEKAVGGWQKAPYRARFTDVLPWNLETVTEQHKAGMIHCWNEASGVQSREVWSPGAFTEGLTEQGEVWKASRQRVIGVCRVRGGRD